MAQRRRSSRGRHSAHRLDTACGDPVAAPRVDIALALPAPRSPLKSRSTGSSVTEATTTARKSCVFFAAPTKRSISRRQAQANRPSRSDNHGPQHDGAASDPPLRLPLRPHRYTLLALLFPSFPTPRPVSPSPSSPAGRSGPSPTACPPLHLPLQLPI